MFGSIGGPEFLLIAVLALLLFGPRKLPQIGKSIGRALAEFRGATQEFKNSLEREVEIEDIRGVKDSLTSAGREIADSVKQVARPTVARNPVDPDDAGRSADSTPGNERSGASTREADPPPADASDGESPTQS